MKKSKKMTSLAEFENKFGLKVIASNSTATGGAGTSFCREYEPTCCGGTSDHHVVYYKDGNLVSDEIICGDESC